MNLLKYSLLFFVFFAFLSGCSSTNQNPVKPLENTFDDFILVADIDENVAKRDLIGMWSMQFDTESLILSVESNRDSAAQWNITGMIPTPSFDVVSYDPLSGILNVDATIQNPTSLSAYDIRLVVYTDNLGSRLTNADDWTMLFDISGGSQINPFKAFAKNELNREFTGEGTEHTQRLQLFFPTEFTMLNFAITASWPENCDEPYQIKNFWHNELYDSSGHETQAEVSVYDWQDDVDEVNLSCPAITGEDMVAFTKHTALRWVLDIQNNTGASAGNYTGYIKATSENSGLVALYDMVEIVVMNTPIVEGIAITWGGEDYDVGESVAVDNDKNMYVAGEFENTCDFDPSIFEETRTSSGEKDAYIAKYDEDWNLLWVQSWGNQYKETVKSVGIDSIGDIYVVGDFVGLVDFDPGQGTELHSSGGAGNRHIFLCKYSQNGDFLWARTWGGTGEHQIGYDLSIDNSDNIHVCGTFAGSCDFDPGSGVDIHTSINSWYDPFLSRFAPNGDFVWALTWGGANTGYCVSVTNDIENNIIATGVFADIADFDPGSGIVEKSSTGDFDVFIIKLDENGIFDWVQTFGGTSRDFPDDITTDSSSNIFLTGYFHQTIDLDSGSSTDNHTSNGGSDVFLSKFTSSGEYLWGNTWGGAGGEYVSDDYSYALTIDDSENACVTGMYSGTVDFDPTPGGFDIHSNNWFCDIYLCAYDTDGNYLWVNTWGGIYYETGNDVVFNDGNFYLTGCFGQTCDFDPGTGLDIYTANGYLDAFLLRYSR